jgi:hypothetical protein
MDRGWGFEEADDYEGPSIFGEQDGEAATAAGGDEDLATGADPDGVVTIAVDDDADVVSVRLAGNWQDEAIRRVLAAKVVEAMSAATAQAVARRAQQIDAQAGEPVTAPVRPQAEESPITMEDALRRVHQVSADLAQFEQRLSATVEQAVTAESGGGHVSVSGQGRQIGEVSLDQAWLFRARVSEVESELRDALATFGARSSLGELSQGPRSSAISELLALVADPGAMARRIKQGSGHGHVI